MRHTSQPAAALPADLSTSLAAGLQHIALLQGRIARLAAALDDAQDQLLHRLGSAHRTGDITDAQLVAAWRLFCAADTPAKSRHWNEHVDIPYQRMIHVENQLPNGPSGSWFGDWPYPSGAPAPLSGTPVVYVLFDEVHKPCYVGSTKNFSARLSAHAKDGKIFVHWQAHPCRSREDAYQLEERLLKQHKPYLNRRAGR